MIDFQEKDKMEIDISNIETTVREKIEYLEKQKVSKLFNSLKNVFFYQLVYIFTCLFHFHCSLIILQRYGSIV